MIRAVVLLSLVAVGLALPLTFDVDKTWEMYKSTHGKQYVGDVETARKLIFREHVKYIERHNMEADMGKHTYWLGLNEYTDWSNEEFRSYMNGYNQKLRQTNGSTFMAPENLMGMPNTVDWRQKGYVTEVKNQKQCGSCWSFSATGSLEGQHFRKTGKLVSLSEQNLVDCSTSEGDQGCNGGIMDFAFNYVQKNNGIDTEKCYAYEARDATCRFRRNCVGATCTGHVDIPSEDEQALTQALATVGPISVAIDAGHMSFQMYKHGVYNEPECSSTQLDHGVLAVGYGTDSMGGDYYIVKNSWGPTWGLNGYIHMSRNKNNQCGIATQASYPLV